ncbi:MAG: DNA polymerase IV [Alphaproteobacteria bacterium]|jgi:DNA polymerase-4|nr:DNA polymerase IV [Alphaproteobacteria bacterium]
MGLENMATPGLCRDCGAIDGSAGDGRRCATCGSPRLVRHAELHRLAIAHLDCDAFYAAIEKRDRPELRDRAVIVGGGRRGVVSAACYTARLYGVRSAMPMFKALERCPDAVVIKPDMAKYAEVGRRIRALMEGVTPLVEPLSIDEAFLDLTGTVALHGGSPASTCARLARRIEEDCGITVSIGLAANKFLAKLASDLEKPRGFAVIGRAEAEDLLAGLPVGRLWGVGRALTAKLAADGIATIGQLRLHEEHELVARYGSIGRRLHRFARGRDERAVQPGAPPKSVSAETTFDADLAAAADLRRALWPLCEKVADRLKRKHLAGRTVTLKLKTAQFRTVTRAVTLPAATQLADTLFRTATPLVDAAASGTGRFRLIGIAAGDLTAGDHADPPDLLDPDLQRRKRVETAIDAVRAKLGRDAIAKGRTL